MIPKQWHIHTVDLEPRIGTKPGKQRPFLAIQPDAFAEEGLDSTVILPLTTRLVHGNAYPLRVRIPQGTAGLQHASDILIDQILAWDNGLFRETLGALPESLVSEVKTALRDFLDL